MLKKTIRRLGALAMVLAMAVSVFAVNASAADKEVVAKKDVTISKTVSASNKVLTKAETYNFTISAGDAVTATAAYGISASCNEVTIYVDGAQIAFPFQVSASVS